MSKFFRISALVMFTAVLLGNGLACNTSEGMGKDIERGGEKLQDAAD